jgi:hypothetical protein
MSPLRDHLHRYWFRWKAHGNPGTDPVLSRVGADLGCGVTAVDAEDARNLISAIALDGSALPDIADVVEDVDVRTLDEGHVLPNMGDPTVRGVWYPRY